MTQFWAMLRDSFREAIDGWVFLTMFVLGGIMILVVATTSVAPVPADRALPEMLGGGGFGGAAGQAVAADRGRSDRTAIFLYKPEVADIRAEEGAAPWTSPVAFTLRYVSVGRGAAGIEAELDENGKPKLDKLDKLNKNSVLLGDPFEEAVRFWATPPGGAKPDYGDALAREFITAQVRANTGLEVTEVVVKPKAQAKGGGGFFGELLGGEPAAPEFAVTCGGGTRNGWAFEPSFAFGAYTPGWAFSLGGMVYFLESRLVNGVGVWVILMVGVVVTAGFVPNMLRKGQIDLLLCKPIARPLILIYKYIGGLVFVFLLTAFTLGGIWLVVGLRTGVWAPGLLWCVPVVTAYFAILYALSTLVGVLTRNVLVSILATVVFWLVLFLIGFSYTFLLARDAMSKIESPTRSAAKGVKAEPPKPDAGPPQWSLDLFYVLNKVTPRTNDLDDLSARLIADSVKSDAERSQTIGARKGANWAGAVGVSAVWIALFLGLALARFVTRSY